MRSFLYGLMHLLAAVAFVAGIIFAYSALSTPFTVPIDGDAQRALMLTQASYYGVMALMLFAFALVLEVAMGFSTNARKQDMNARRMENGLAAVVANSAKTNDTMIKLGKLLSSRSVVSSSIGSASSITSDVSMKPGDKTPIKATRPSVKTPLLDDDDDDFPVQG